MKLTDISDEELLYIADIINTRTGMLWYVNVYDIDDIRANLEALEEALEESAGLPDVEAWKDAMQQ